LVESICLFQNQSIRFSNDYLILGTDQNQIEVKCELFEKTIFNFVYKINWNGSLLRFICYEEISKVFKGGENKIVIASFAFDGFAIFGSILLNKNNNIPLKEIKEIETNIVELISAIENVYCNQ
jgi:hypothetical protein